MERDRDRVLVHAHDFLDHPLQLGEVGPEVHAGDYGVTGALAEDEVVVLDREPLPVVLLAQTSLTQVPSTVKI